MKENKPKTREEARKAKKKTSWGKRIFKIFFAFMLVILLAGGGLFAYYAKDAPKISQADLEGNYASELVDANGDVFYSLGGEEREFATLDQYNDYLIDALLSTEDQQFYRHFGINPVAIMRAAFGYVLNKGHIVGGGSTITQQLVKNSVFSTLKADQTLKRKAQEAWLSIKIEREYSKDQILTYYMNKIHMGKNIYGMATAAKEYYGKAPDELKLNEAALLAGMPQAPNYYNPYENPKAATKRRNTVLNAMVKTKKITKKEAEKAKKVPIQEGLVEESEQPGNNLVFDGYLTAVLKEVKEKTNFDPYTDGLRIETNLDMSVQKTLYDIANTNGYVPFPNDEIQTAISVVEPETGKVLGIIGGRNQEGQLSENRALSNGRSIGSTIKPLIDYGPAIEHKDYSTYHLVEDKPFELDGWKLNNYDNNFRGQLTLREALVDSRNTVAARLFNEDLDKEQIKSFLENLGIDPTKITPGSDDLVPSSAINGNLSAVQLAGSYSAFANGGNYTPPYTVKKIITPDGKEENLTPKTHSAMKDSTAYMITDMLKDVPKQYSDMGISNVVHAGKTGTTNFTDEQLAEHNIPASGAPDTWYVGYSKNFTISVWTGYDELFTPGHYLMIDDGSMMLSRRIFTQAMTALSADIGGSDWKRPKSVVARPVYMGSSPAELPDKNTPKDKIVNELFVKGTEPTKVHKSKDSKPLPAPKGLEAKYTHSDDTIHISWSKFNEDTDDEEPVEYVLTINGESKVIGGTSYDIKQPEAGDYNISLALRRGDKIGKSSTVKLTIKRQDQDSDNEDPSKDKDKPEPPEEQPDDKANDDDDKDKDKENEREENRNE